MRRVRERSDVEVPSVSRDHKGPLTSSMGNTGPGEAPGVFHGTQPERDSDKGITDCMGIAAIVVLAEQTPIDYPSCTNAVEWRIVFATIIGIG